MATIHPTAIIHAGAELDEDVEVGPYCIVSENARIASGTRLLAHVVVDGITIIGSDCTIYPFASLGTRTQDLKYRGGVSSVEIGGQTTIRESVTVNAATMDGDCTRVGSGCLLMAYCHVAHDCVVGDNVIIANCGTLAGHVILDDHVIVGGLTGIHQFVRIGTMSIIGGCSKVTQDLPPFMMADGHPLRVRGINRVGLDRKHVGEESQRCLKHAYRILYRQDLATSIAVERIGEEVNMTPEIGALIAFIQASSRGISK